MTRAILRDPLLRNLALGGSALIGWLLFGGATPSVKIVAYWLALMVFNTTQWAVSRRVVRRPEIPPATRRFWRAVSACGALFAIGNAYQTVYALRHPGPESSVPTVAQSGFVLLGIGLVIWVMLTQKFVHLSRPARIRFWLDSATVLIGAAVLVWFLVLPSGGFTVGPPAPVLVGCALVLVAVFAATKLLLSGAAPMTAGSAAPMLVACIVQSFCGGLVTGTAEGLSMTLAVQVIAPGLVCVGPRVQELTARYAADRLLRKSRRPYSYLPYAVMAIVFGLLPVVLPSGLHVTAWVTMGGLLVITALVVVRQLLAFDENDGLLRRLDTSLLALGRQEERIRSLLEYSSDITSIVDMSGTMTYLTPATSRILGRAPEDLVGTRVLAHTHPDDLPTIMPTLRHLMSTPHAAVTFQARIAHADGSWRWLEVVSRNLVEEPSIGAIVSNARDVTEAKLLNDRMRYEASHDALTGLANRSLFGERLAVAALAGTAVLNIDLDGFKAINDTYGHHVGDAVLVEVAHRLRACMPDNGLPARLGGDEFAVLLPAADAGEAESVAAHFRSLLQAPVIVFGHDLDIGASVGVATTAATTDPEELLRLADAEMYRIKRDGRTARERTLPSATATLG